MGEIAKAESCEEENGNPKVSVPNKPHVSTAKELLQAILIEASDEEECMLTSM